VKNRLGSLIRSGALLALAAVAVPAGAQAQRTAPGEGPARMTARATVAAITRQDAMSRVYTLADDSMMGRDAGTRGNVKGTDYIAAEARRIGLVPMGDNGTFFQAIPLVHRGVDPASSLTPSGGNALALWTDFAPVPHVSGLINVGDAMRVTSAPVVYGGVWGDSAALKPAQARGKFVVFGAPMGQNGRPDFRVWARGALGSYEGVAGMAIAVLDGTPPQVVDFFRREQMVMKSEKANTGPAALLVTTAAAERLLGAPIGSLQPGAAAPTARTVTGGFRYAERPTAFPARNVIAVLRGSDPVLRNQYVAVGAHNDHVGIAEKAMDHDSLRVLNRLFRPEGAEQPDPATLTPAQVQQLRAGLDSIRRVRPARLDSVFNGADDDASGSAGVLEIAQYLASRRPKRSVIFVWHTAEEKGLFGSEYFTDHPTVPRDSIVAQLNIDMIGRGRADDVKSGGRGYLQLVGSRRLSTQLGDLVEEVNRTGNHGFTLDYSMDADGHPANIYCRSDHYNYARWGIPVTFFTTGGHADYHMLTDEAQYVDYDKLVSVSRFIAGVAESVANRGTRVVVDKPKPDPNGTCKQ
jgi:hypothetical protein